MGKYIDGAIWGLDPRIAASSAIEPEDVRSIVKESRELGAPDSDIKEFRRLYNIYKRSRVGTNMSTKRQMVALLISYSTDEELLDANPNLWASTVGRHLSPESLSNLYAYLVPDQARADVRRAFTELGRPIPDWLPTDREAHTRLLLRRLNIAIDSPEAQEALKALTQEDEEEVKECE